MARRLTPKEKAEHRVARPATPRPAPVEPAPEPIEPEGHEPIEDPVDQGVENAAPESAEPTDAPGAPEAAAKAADDVDLAPDSYHPRQQGEEQEEGEEEAEPTEGAAELLPKEWVILREAASFGPVTIEGRKLRCKKGVLYWVPSVEERADILGTGRFRAATQQDLAKSREPSSGPGGSITRELLPPGALKGGLAAREREAD